MFMCIRALDGSVESTFFMFSLQKYVQMSALDDKDVPSAEQWRDAVTFMTSALSRQIKKAEADMQQLVGPTSYYDRWLLWKSQSASQVCNSNVIPVT